MTKEEGTRLTYEGNGVFVNVFHGRASYELGVEIGRTGHKGEEYHLAEVLDVVAPETAKDARYQTSDRAGLEKGLRRFAMLLADHGAPFLRNEPGAFDRLVEPVARARRIYTNGYRFGAVRDRAQKAWEEKNWSEVLSLYSSMEEGLSETEARRLAYLRRRITPDGQPL